MSEAKAAKFKVGDRVEVIADQGNFVKAGMQFVVGRVNGHKNFYYDGDPNGYGVWEKNLKLVTVDFAGVNVGDRVRLTGNDEIHEFVVCDTDKDAIYDRTDNDYYAGNGWTVEILERAKPELPTEPGLYHSDSTHTDVYYDGATNWTEIGSWASIVNPERFAPLTRLAPVKGND